MKFYKRKIFYAALMILLVIIPLFFLVAKPFMLISWNNLEFPSEKRLKQIQNSIKGDNIESINKFLKSYVPNRFDFYYPMLYHSKTAKRDFIIAHSLGFDWNYLFSYRNAIDKGFYLTELASYMALGLTYNLSNFNEEHIKFLSYVKSKTPTYLKNTQEPVDYLAENNYFNTEEYKLIHWNRIAYILMYFALFEDLKECFSREQKGILLKQLQEDYQALQSIKDEKLKKLMSVKYESFDKMLWKYNNLINKAKELLDECQ